MEKKKEPKFIDGKGNFLCFRCQEIARVGVVIKGKVYCQKCGQELKCTRKEKNDDSKNGN